VLHASPCTLFLRIVINLLHNVIDDNFMGSFLSLQHVARLAEKHREPYILCGDFNIKPGDATHRLITTGSIDADHPEMPKPREWDIWMPSVPAAMKSAYMEVRGRSGSVSSC